MLTNEPHQTGEVNGDSRKFYEPAVSALTDTVTELRRLDRQLVDKARQRPLVAAAVALAAGYVLGRIFSRFG